MVLRVPQPVERVALPGQEQIRRTLANPSTLVVDLGTVRDRRKYEIIGRCLWAVGGDQDATVDVYLTPEQSQPITMRPGQYWSGFPYGALFLSNDAQAGKSITLLYADQPIVAQSPATLFANVTSVSKPYDYVTNAGLGSFADGGNQLILSANPNRRAILFAARASNATGQGLGRGSAPTYGSLANAFFISIPGLNNVTGFYEIPDTGDDDIYVMNQSAPATLAWAEGVVS